jgi:hypothetical protein
MLFEKTTFHPYREESKVIDLAELNEIAAGFSSKPAQWVGLVIKACPQGYEADGMYIRLLLPGELKGLARWIKFVLPGVVNQCPDRRESFNNFTDMLCRDGDITEDVYKYACLPDCLETCTQQEAQEWAEALGIWELC